MTRERDLWRRAREAVQRPSRLPGGMSRALRRSWRRARLSTYRLARYDPRSCLVTPEHSVTRARFEAVDAHAHLGTWLMPDATWVERDVPRLVGMLDTCNIAAVVNLDGRWGDELERNLDRYDRAFPLRFATFCHLDWRETRRRSFTDRLVQGLQRSAAAGACGVKVWKDLGLRVRDDGGRLVLPDDPRLDDVWSAAGELALPVLIHTGDPVAFFHPVDRHNERLEELVLNPQWSLAGARVPPLPALLDSLEAAVETHPGTTWIGAHVGCYAENLAWVERMLAAHPNFAIDLSGRLAEIGRQPLAARRLFTQYADRVLFGTDDFPLDAARYGIYFRFLETSDEHFPYAVDGAPVHGRWRISGLGLPDDVLRRVYRDNARRLIAGLDR